MCDDPHEQTFIGIAFSWGPSHIWLLTMLEDPWPHYVILEVCWGGLWTLSFGLSQFHGHGSWLVCEVALGWRDQVGHDLHPTINSAVFHRHIYIHTRSQGCLLYIFIYMDTRHRMCAFTSRNCFHFVWSCTIKWWFIMSVQIVDTFFPFFFSPSM